MSKEVFGMGVILTTVSVYIVCFIVGIIIDIEDWKKKHKKEE